MSIAERYRSAVNSKNLKPDARKGDEGAGFMDVDVLGAVGLASRRHPLGAALERLFAGHNAAAAQIVAVLTDMAFDHSWEMEVKISRPKARDMAQACLAYHRNGTCRACGGHGKTRIPETNVLSEHDCQACRDPRTGMGTGRVLFERNFRQEHQSLARWLVSEMEREVGRIAPAAMRLLASKMEL